jgi:prephenate dehydrogenase
MARTVTRVHNPDYPPDRGLPGMLARLANEDWAGMTKAANASPGHVKSLDRWITKAQEANARLSDEQAERLAVMMRRAHFVRMGKLSAQARKLAREAQAALDAAPAS